MDRSQERAANIALHLSPPQNITDLSPSTPIVAENVAEVSSSIKQKVVKTKKNKEKEEVVQFSGEGDDYPEEVDVSVVEDPVTHQLTFQPVPHTLSFDQGFFHAVRALELLIEKNRPGAVIIVGIAGPTGAGKTTLAGKIAPLFDGVVISLENFVHVENAIDGNNEDPTLVDFELAVEVLKQLKETKSAKVPKIQKKGILKKDWVQVTLKEQGPCVLILEGSYALNVMLRPLLDVTIAINGGVHLDLIKRIVRDITETKSKDTLVQVTSLVFPMFKAYIEPDLEQAKIRISSAYNPMLSLVEPTYVCKAKYQMVKQSFDAQYGNMRPIKKIISDMYLYPPSKVSIDPMNQTDRANWIRIRRSEGHFQIHFYNETMEQNINTRPSIHFEISVKTIGGLLSLGYQIGAILNRTVEIYSDAGGVVVTKEYFKELEKYYVQLKGKNRRDVLAWAQKLHINEYHLPQTFIYLYFKKLRKQKKLTANTSPITTASSIMPSVETTSITPNNVTPQSKL